MDTSTFADIIGCILGALIISYGVFVCSAPLKFIIKIIVNSFLGCIILFALNHFSGADFLHGGINPLTAVCVGILGIPGVIAIIILS